MPPAMKPLSDEVLDPQRWLERHGDYLYRYALAKIRRSEAAEDLVQDALLAAWRGREKFVGIAAERSWLTAILKRKIVDWLRQSIRERSRQTTLDPDIWVEGLFDRTGHWSRGPARWPGDAPGSNLERAEFWNALHGCADQLPGRLRDAFVLWHLEEQSTQEVCGSLAITPTNLWVTLHRARLRLWKCLSGHGNGPSPLREGRKPS